MLAARWQAFDRHSQRLILGLTGLMTLSLGGHLLPISSVALRSLQIADGVLLLLFALVRLRQCVVAERRRWPMIDLLLLFGLVAWVFLAGWPGSDGLIIQDDALGAARFYIVASMALVGFWRARQADSRLQEKIAELNTRPPVVILASFMVLILSGTFLLMFPMSTRSGSGLRPVDALFTATSASCVTGLIVYQDTGTDLTRFGQVVVLGLIQLGGLGILVFSTFFLQQRGSMSLRQMQASREFIDAAGPRKMGGLVKLIIFSTLAIETFGALCLLPWMKEKTGDWPSGIYYAVFHSVSAFCNAGFSLWDDSLTGVVGSTGSMLVLMGLIITGGLGFSVYAEIAGRRPWRKSVERLSLHSRLVLLTTLVLLVCGALMFYLFERNGVLSGMSGRDRLMHATFQSVTTRTAGFNTVQIGDLSGASLLLFYAWMLIGGSPGSTAGGIKTVTVVVLILSLISIIRGQEETVVFGRTLSRTSITRALLITVLSVFILFVASLLMLATQEGRFEVILFEVFSAFGTVGLSAGLTAKLTVFGKLTITVLMLLGRLGPLTVITALTAEVKPSRVKYVEERVAIG